MYSFTSVSLYFVERVPVDRSFVSTQSRAQIHTLVKRYIFVVAVVTIVDTTESYQGWKPNYTLNDVRMNHKRRTETSPHRRTVEHRPCYVYRWVTSESVKSATGSPKFLFVTEDGTVSRGPGLW